ncbi:MAG TPA: hypothetical protein VFD60_08415 [Nitrososphaeraceae archaeon]|nr:hypothetical protein [Nitrososphaeraceae archaeon]
MTLQKTNLIESISIPLFSWFISGYDLSLDALFANTIAKTFFPSSDFIYSLLAVYGVLSLSLLARFGGAIALGRFGDRHQRRPVVIICLIILTMTMFVSWLLASSINANEYPNPNSIKSTIFILTRILVGFSIGGLWPTASVWGLENRAFNIRSTIEPDNDTDSKEQKDQTIIRKNLLPHGGFMQFGFHLGWITSAILLWYWQHPLDGHKVLTATSDIMQFGWLSFIGCLISLVVLLFCLWKMNASNMLEERKTSLEISNKLHGLTSLEISNKLHEPGSIKALFTNHRDAMINLWLIMNGLFFLYYPSTVITTKVLAINGLNSPYPFQIFPTITIFLFTVVLFAHGIPVLLYWLLRIWEPEKPINKFVTKRYKQLYKLYYLIYARVLSIVGLMNRAGQQSTQSNCKDKTDDEIEEISRRNIDIVIIVLTGLILIVIVILGFILLNASCKCHLAEFTPKDLNLVWYTAIVIFFANTIWALIPSLLSGSFPTELRNTASTLIYQGGLVIAFSSPFISMQYYLLEHQGYLLIFPIILGAISIIIGGGRMVSSTKIAPRILTSAIDGYNNPVKNDESTSSNIITFRLTSSRGTPPINFQCRLDKNSDFSKCPSNLTFRDLASGQHKAQFRATDSTALRGPSVSFTWHVQCKGRSALGNVIV